MRVVILGPNLIDQSKGSFVIHKEGCRDIPRVKDLSGGPAPADWVIDATGREAVVREVYQDIISEGEEPWQAFESDLHFCPCCEF